MGFAYPTSIFFSIAALGADFRVRSAIVPVNTEQYQKDPGGFGPAKVIFRVAETILSVAEMILSIAKMILSTAEMVLSIAERVLSIAEMNFLNRLQDLADLVLWWLCHHLRWFVQKRVLSPHLAMWLQIYRRLRQLQGFFVLEK